MSIVVKNKYNKTSNIWSILIKIFLQTFNNSRKDWSKPKKSKEKLKKYEPHPHPRYDTDTIIH